MREKTRYLKRNRYRSPNSIKKTGEKTLCLLDDKVIGVSQELEEGIAQYWHKGSLCRSVERNHTKQVVLERSSRKSVRKSSQ